MTMHDVSSAIRSVGGTIWLSQSESYGFLFRANVGTHQIRVIVPNSDQSPSAIPPAPSYLTHLVKDIQQLKGWLFIISPTRIPCIRRISNQALSKVS